MSVDAAPRNINENRDTLRTEVSVRRVMRWPVVCTQYSGGTKWGN
jgi:hypothetical protein